MLHEFWHHHQFLTASMSFEFKKFLSFETLTHGHHLNQYSVLLSWTSKKAIYWEWVFCLLFHAAVDI